MVQPAPAMPSQPSRLIKKDSDARPDTRAAGIAFPATQWSMVLMATSQQSAASAKALNELCRRYWYPIYGFLRGRNFGREDAQDITQAFFMKAVAGGLLQHADQERGKLRSFLLAALERHLADHLRHERAEKRGGRAVVLPMECYTAEERFANEPTDHRDPEKLFLAAWARDLMEEVLRKLRVYYEQSDRGALFRALEPHLAMDEGGVPYQELARQLNLKADYLRVQVSRMRQRYARAVREEVALTVQTPEELEEEMGWLAAALRGD